MMRPAFVPHILQRPSKMEGFWPLYPPLCPSVRGCNARPCCCSWSAAADAARPCGGASSASASSSASHGAAPARPGPHAPAGPAAHSAHGRCASGECGAVFRRGRAAEAPNFVCQRLPAGFRNGLHGDRPVYSAGAPPSHQTDAVHHSGCAHGLYCPRCPHGIQTHGLQDVETKSNGVCCCGGRTLLLLLLLLLGSFLSWCLWVGVSGRASRTHPRAARRSAGQEGHGGGRRQRHQGPQQARARAPPHRGPAAAASRAEGSNISAESSRR